MPEAFSRKQSLLRREDGQAAGFVRFEWNGPRSRVEVSAEGLIGEARALLLQPGSGRTLSLGGVRKGKGTFSLQAEEMQGYAHVALLSGDKLLLVAGEGADFRVIRRQIACQQAALKAPQYAEPAKASDPSRQVAQDTPAFVDEPKGHAKDTRSDGWVFTPAYAPNAPERVAGRFLQNGHVLATLEGVAGDYAPEPPPGLMGFVWDAGYWLKVDANRG